MYTRLPQESPRKEPEIDLFPDTQDGESKAGITNYLDEFLSAIKVFGYLERPVFHELTRTMQTRKLIAGETIMLEEEKGFCLVVDGLVQIFVKSQRDAQTVNGETIDLFEDDNNYHEGHQGYQLLTEVSNGASMSSLFSILSLFTEDIRLRFDDTSRPVSSAGYGINRTPGTAPQSPMFATSPMRGSDQDFIDPIDESIKSQQLPNVPPFNLSAAFDETQPNGPNSERSGKTSKRKKSAHPDIVARAVSDTTIAIIPASAFRRLTRVYPKSTAHIVQVILARLQRVTLSTAHQYLGLTTEVLQIEKMMNKYTSYDLPNHLRGNALDRLRTKFEKERARIGSDDITKGIALHNPGANKSRRRSSTSLRKEAALTARLAATRELNMTNESKIAAPRTFNSDISAGDLAANVPLRQPNRSGSLSVAWDQNSNPDDLTLSRVRSPLERREKPPFRPSFENGMLHRQNSINEDGIFRESVLD